MAKYCEICKKGNQVRKHRRHSNAKPGALGPNIQLTASWSTVPPKSGHLQPALLPPRQVSACATLYAQKDEIRLRSAAFYFMAASALRCERRASLPRVFGFFRASGNAKEKNARRLL